MKASGNFEIHYRRWNSPVWAGTDPFEIAKGELISDVGPVEIGPLHGCCEPHGQGKEGCAAAYESMAGSEECGVVADDSEGVEVFGDSEEWSDATADVLSSGPDMLAGHIFVGGAVARAALDGGRLRFDVTPDPCPDLEGKVQD